MSIRWNATSDRPVAGLAISLAGRPSLVLLLLSVMGLCSCARQDTNDAREETPVITTAPSTTYPMPPLGKVSVADLGWVLVQQGNAARAGVTRAKVSDYKRKVLVLDFYATWCQPCRQSIPHLMALHRRYESRGLAIVGLNVGGPDDRVKVPDFAREFGIEYPLAFPDRALEDLLLADNGSIPQTFVFDREGLLVRRFIGYEASAARELDEEIERQTSNESTRVP